MTARPDAYVLCTSPRSGSTLLCGMLRATGVAGHPESWFHRPSVAAWAEAHDVPPGPDRLPHIFAAALRRGRDASDIFGLRMQSHSFPHFRARLAELHPDAAGDAARIEAAFGRTAYIHLRREDDVAQAVSYLRATQSGLWHRNADGSERERSAPPSPARYDFDAIAAKRAEFEADRAAWRDWFEAEGIVPLKLTYEELARDPRAALARVLSFLGLEAGPARGVALPTARLADARSAEWAARFRADIRSR